MIHPYTVLGAYFSLRCMAQVNNKMKSVPIGRTQINFWNTSKSVNKLEILKEYEN